MKSKIELPEMGCYCERNSFFNEEYRLIIEPDKCGAEIVVPFEAEGIPITGICFADREMLGRTKLSKLTVHAPVRDIQDIDYLFGRSHAEKLELVIDKDNPYLRVYDDVLYSGDCLIHTLDMRKSSYDILPGTRVIDSFAFSSCDISRIDLPESVTEISWGVFMNCRALTEVVFPNSLKTIERFAFFCSGLKSAVIPKSVTVIGETVFNDCGRIEIFDNLLMPCRDFNRCRSGYELIVRSSESGEELYRIFMPNDRGFYVSLRNSLKKCGRFDFELYDEMALDKDRNQILCNAREAMIPAAMTRLSCPVELSEAAKEKYLGYLYENREFLFNSMLNVCGVAELEFVAEIGLITEDNIFRLIDRAAELNRTELTAFLLDLKNRRFPDATPPLPSID